jgi:nitrite reductase/ring-hydroxylating ferredoxin subunit
MRRDDLTPLHIDQILYDLVVIFKNYPNLFYRNLYIMTKTKIASTSDVSVGKVLKTKANTQSILVAKVGDKYCAIANKCPHLGLPLAKGKFENGVITCPFHGSKFEICGGKNTEWVDSVVGIPLPGIAKKMMAMGKSATNVASFAVSQEGEDLFIDA